MRKYFIRKNNEAVNRFNKLRDKNKADTVGILFFIAIEILALLFIICLAP